MRCKRIFDRPALTLTLLGVLICTCSCAPEVIPKELEGQVDRKVSFLQLKESPETYTGRMVVLGGEVISAKRNNDSTRIEVLQLPLDSSLEPVPDRTTSQGRVLVIQKAFLDPATVPVGSRVTMIGEMTGTTTLPIDDVQYPYPTIALRHLKVWERVPPGVRPPVSIGIGGGVGGGGGFGGIGGGVGF